MNQPLEPADESEILDSLHVFLEQCLRECEAEGLTMEDDNMKLLVVWMSAVKRASERVTADES